MKRILPAFFVLMLTTSAWGQDFEKGLEAYERHDYAAALRLWRPLAEQGDIEAQVYIGAIYQDGEGVPQDFAEAARWYHKAAEQGDEGADIYLNQVLRILKEEAEDAVGREDYATAFKLFEVAAELGDAGAQTLFGLMYYDGIGTPQDYREAKSWLLKAVAQGYAGAQNALGNMYYFGQGVPQDYKPAMKWYLMAAKQSDARAQSALGETLGDARKNAAQPDIDDHTVDHARRYRWVFNPNRDLRGETSTTKDPALGVPAFFVRHGVTS